MKNLLQKFTVTELTPRNAHGQPVAEEQPSYELTRASVHPTIVVGRDKLGRPVEATVNIHYSRCFVHPSGTLNSVMLRTGAVMSMHADAIAYENETIHELVTEGWIPAWLCPYSTRYQHITGGGAFVANPDNIPDCGGDEASGGCVHLKQIIALRSKATLDNYQAELEQHTKMNKAQATDLLRKMSMALDVAEEIADGQDDGDSAKPRRPRAK